MRAVTEEAYRLGIYFFVIAGGEPLLRQEMVQITQDYPEIIFLVFTKVFGFEIMSFLELGEVDIPTTKLYGDGA